MFNKKGHIEEIKSKLKNIDQMVDQGMVTDDILLSRMDLMKQLHDVQSSNNRDVVQKAKVRWAIEGDENSKYFHAIINKKRAHLSVKGVLVDGDWKGHIEEIKSKLKNIDQMVDQGMVTDDILLSRMDLMKQLHDVQSSNNRDVVQKAKVRWAIEGDENSKYFHAIINSKRAYLSVKGVLVDGDWVDDPICVKQEFCNHFATRFQDPGPSRGCLNFDFPFRLNDEQNSVLESPVTGKGYVSDKPPGNDRMISTQVFINPEIFTNADGAQSSECPVPLPKDPYEAIRQAYLVGMDTESEPFGDLIEAETPDSPHTVASPTSLLDSTPPACRVEESKCFGTSCVRSKSSDSTASLSPGHPLTHITPVLVPSLCRIACKAMRVPPAMSPGFSASIVEVATMTDLAFHKRFRSSYDSSSLPTLLDDGLAARDGGLGMRVESLGLRGDETIHEGQQRATSVMETAVDEPLGLGYRVLRCWEIASREGQMSSVFEVGQGSRYVSEPERPERVLALRQPTLTTWIDPEDGRAYIDVPAYPSPSPPVHTPLSPKWSSSLLPVFPAPSIVLLPISSHMISLTVLSSVASPATDETEGFLTELGAQVEMQGGLIRDHMVRLRELSPALFEKSLEHEQTRTAVTFGALWRHVLALEAWAGCFVTRIADMSWAIYDDHILVHNMLLQQAALQRELQEMRGRVTALEQEKDRRERTCKTINDQDQRCVGQTMNERPRLEMGERPRA
nr:RNA-directed DNA polymerase, eukaryota [Tanacetum cinerariifolium]